MKLKRLVLAVLLAVAGTACQDEYEFDPVTAGEVDTARAPRPKTDGQFLRSVYADLLGRAPGQLEVAIVDAGGNVLSEFPLDEQELLLTVLDGVGDDDAMRSLVVAGLVESEELKLPRKEEVADPASFVAEQFRAFLGREPNAYELDAFVSAWNEDPAVDPKVVVRAIIGSREYQSQ
jgi:hypothetical protein